MNKIESGKLFFILKMYQAYVPCTNVPCNITNISKIDNTNKLQKMINKFVEMQYSIKYLQCTYSNNTILGSNITQFE